MNSHGYMIVKIFNEMMIGTDHPEYGRQLWGLAKLTKKHKGDLCAMCGLSVGTVAFRPSTNKSNRMKRICVRHLTKG